MKHRFCLVVAAFLIAGLCSVPAAFAQDQDDDGPSPSSQRQQGPATKKSKDDNSGRDTEVSSSKDTRIDLSPPKDDAKNHPESGAAIVDSEEQASDTDEMHAWDPHRAAKDVEVGDYYFKRKNYRGAMERYKDALTYKPNDATANFRLAECEEKTGNSSDAVQHYQAYLKILPEGPFAADAQRALERLKTTAKK
jgi:tetratricopeptide (TPR) repeat protein